MGTSTTRLFSWGLVFLLISLIHLAPSVDAAVTNTTTGGPATTPVPDAGALAFMLGAQSSVVLSFRIDGVAYVARCNVSGVFNMSACVFDVDHGLTVSPIGGTTTTQSLPDYYLVMVILTLLMTVVLVGLGGAGYIMMGKIQDGYERVIQNAQYQSQYPPQAQPPQQAYQNVPSIDPYGQQPQQYSMPQPQTYARLGSRSKRVINVDLVKPCLPGDLLTMMP